MKKPTPNAIPMSANDLERLSGGVLSEMYACAVVRFPAVRPSMTRATKMSQRASARAMRRKPRNVPIWLTMRTGLRPCLSERVPRIGPETSWQPAYVETRSVA